MTNLQLLKELAPKVTMLTQGTHHLTTYSPGDGVTRYRIVRGEDDYFGGYAQCNAYGAAEGVVMCRAFMAGWVAR